jgi:solute carrier family 35
MKQGGKEYSFLDDARDGGDDGSRSIAINKLRALFDSTQPSFSTQRKDGSAKLSREFVKIGSCIAYGSVSVSITLFNKAIFSVYKFEFPAFLTLLQVSTTIVFMLFLGRTHVFRYCDERTPAFQLSVAKQVLPLAFFWMLYVQSGVIALRYLTVPMFGVMRRATTLLTAAGEYLAFGTITPAASMLSIVVMVTGAAMAGSTDLSFSAKGYAWVSVCVASTAAYLILIRMIGKNTGLNQHALLLYNNLLAFPMILAWFALATDEPRRVLSAPQLLDPRFLIFLFVSVSQAFLLNLCIFWCTTVNSPLATTIVGA